MWINRLAVNLKTSKFLNSVLKYFTGAFISQALGVVLLLVISIYYIAEDAGELAFISSIAMPLAKLSNFSLHQTIILTRNKKYAFVMLFNSIMTALFVNIIILIFFSAISYFVSSDFFSVNNVVQISLVAYSNIANESFKQYFLKIDKISVVSFGMVINAFIILLVSMTYGIIGNTNESLIYALIIGQFCSLLYYMYKSDIQGNYTYLTRVNMFFLIKRYKKFCLYQTPSYVVNNISKEIPIYFLTAFYGKEVSGSFFMAFKLIATPLGVLSTAFSNILYASLSSVKETGKYILKKIRVYAFFTFLLIVGILILLYFLPDSLVPQKWVQAYEMLNYVVVIVFIQSVFSHLTVGFKYKEENKIYFQWEIIRLLLLLVLFLVSVNYSVNILLINYIVIICISYLLLLHFFQKKIN